MARWTLIAGCTLIVALSAATWWLSRPAFDESLPPNPYDDVRIAPTTSAITLARKLDGTVLAVRSASTTGISAIPLASSGDAADAVNVLGVDAIAAQLAAVPASEVRWSELGLPVDTQYPHIAAGTNFKAHAEEVGHEGEPFLFPKLSEATAWNAPVPAAGRMDFEVELCAVPLADYTSGTTPLLGYLLCGDFTDRWQLVKDIDLDGPMGITGFAAGKGGAGRMPLGALLLVPRRPDLYADIQLDLYLNGRLRQRALAGLMIWSPEEIIDRALAACDTEFAHHERTVTLTDCNRIPAGTVILTGTPEGVLFHVATLWSPWSYLQPGDVVVSRASYLGILHNTIE